jgi:hypothetical protein
MYWTLPREANFWWHQNQIMLRGALEVWVYTFEGWERSNGVKQELEFAHSKNIPIRYGLRMESLCESFKKDHQSLVRTNNHV